MNPTTKKPIKSVRISRPKQEQMLAAMERQARQQAKAIDRRTARVSLTFIEEIFVALSHPNGSLVSFTVPSRNLSERGMSFLHGSYVYPQSACCVVLPRKNGKYERISGQIRDCRHVDGLVHEVSLIFLSPICIDDYAAVLSTEPSAPMDVPPDSGIAT